jgi:hypothetical protein
MTIDEEDGYRGTYRAHLEEFSIRYKDGSRNITKTQKINSEKTVCMVIPDEPFESQKEVEVYAKVSFQQKKDNNWVEVTDGGGVVYEEKRATFRTGDRPKEILPEHVVYSYPLNRQYNFYPDEHAQGYLLLSQNYTYLFTDKPEGFDQKIKVSTAAGSSKELSFSYTTSSSVSGIKMEITFPLKNANLEKNTIYTLAITNIPANANTNTNVSMMSNVREVTRLVQGMQADNTIEITSREATDAVATLSEKEIYKLAFKTSRHSTFAEKMSTFDKKSECWSDPIYSFVHDINTNLREPELFDAYEMGAANVNTKIVRFLAKTEQTDWYNQTLYSGMYQAHSYLPAPKDKISILQLQAPNKLLTDDEIAINIASGYGTAGVLKYNLANYCAQDLCKIKEYIAQKVCKGQNISAAETAILNQDHPPMVFRGDYPVAASYVLPGRNIVTSNVTINMYNPVEN